MNKSLLIRSLAIGFTLGMALYAALAPQTINADTKNVNTTATPSTLTKNGRPTICKLDRSDVDVVKTIRGVEFTGYSDTEDQTDSRPWETASGKTVQDGFIASNDYPFGTMVMIPDLFGDKLFTVQDRMNKKYTGKKRVDIFFPGQEVGRENALQFGIRKATMIIVEG